ncbi:MAG: AAA family ATPase [Eubacterium sp.]|nr:AAA family ATPase [Eubacterium sp.]
MEMIDKYKNRLINTALKLDVATETCEKFTKLAHSVADDNSKEATIMLLKEMQKITDNDDSSKDAKDLSRSLNSALIGYYGYATLQSIAEPYANAAEDARTLTELLEELNALIGLDTVKSKVNDLIAYQKVQKLRRENGLYSAKNTLHLAFTGNPGTGKTTVARIVGRIYKQIGLLSKGHFIEVSRTDLIAGYQGQTALKVKKVIEQAKGGVLFIDEAYSITENDHSDSYGRECLTELTKALEDYRDDLVVIVAGYTEPMEKFFESNPGLKSRFNTFIEFPDYSAEEMENILISMCNNNDYVLDEAAKAVIHRFLVESISQKNDNFANGRLARNLYDDLVMNHAKRVFNIQNPTKVDLSVIMEQDFEKNNNKILCDTISNQ